ncbi:unnamed protein product [Lupinus luteus]|uniref:Uncharacterized protein n=1 Tax=Lupinus luteus TaxID=3873 RepID=A0AAV1W342_LUPLU
MVFANCIFCLCIDYKRYTDILEDLKKDPESHGGPPDCIGGGGFSSFSADSLKDEEGPLVGVSTSNLFIANSGNDLPVIDHTRVLQELAYLATDADLVVLVRMVSFSLDIVMVLLEFKTQEMEGGELKQLNIEPPP